METGLGWGGGGGGGRLFNGQERLSKEGSINKEVNYRPKDVTRTQQQIPESSTVILTWQASKKIKNKNKNTRYINSTGGTFSKKGFFQWHVYYTIYSIRQNLSFVNSRPDIVKVHGSRNWLPTTKTGLYTALLARSVFIRVSTELARNSWQQAEHAWLHSDLLQAM